MIEQDGVLILETVETDPNDPEALPQVLELLCPFLSLTSLLKGSTIIASAGDVSLDLSSDLDDSAILAELEAGQDMKPGQGGQAGAEGEDDEEGELKESCHICGKQVMSYFSFLRKYKSIIFVRLPTWINTSWQTMVRKLNASSATKRSQLETSDGTS